MLPTFGLQLAAHSRASCARSGASHKAPVTATATSARTTQVLTQLAWFCWFRSFIWRLTTRRKELRDLTLKQPDQRRVHELVLVRDVEAHDFFSQKLRLELC
jgi:hypothetical protein